MTQAPIEPHHKDMAAKAAGFSSYDRKAIGYGSDHSTVKSILAHAQTLANLEAARADLAEIDRIAVLNCWQSDEYAGKASVAAIAAPYRASDPVHTDGSRSGGQPVTECPKCEAFKREVSDACALVDGFLERDRNSEWKICGDARKTLRRFIIPASDPVAEALRLAMQDVTYDAAAANGLELKGYRVEQEAADNLRAALTKRGLEIVERRDRS